MRRIKYVNVWVVNKLNLMPYKSKQNFQKQYEHFKDIHFDTSRTEDVSLLIKADIPELHLLNQMKMGNANKPIRIKLVLGWVLLGRNNKEQ